jgi:hypothetical protein
MTAAHWETQYELFGFPVDLAWHGGCDLAVLFDGEGWQWRVWRDNHEVGRGLARSGKAAKEQAEGVAFRFLHLVARKQRAA